MIRAGSIDNKSFDFETELLSNSVSTDVNKALSEWEFIKVVHRPGKIKCICKTNIMYVCVYKNRLTNKILPVGRDCQIKYWGDNMGQLIVDDVIRFNENKLFSLKLKILDHLHGELLINEFEYKFYVDIRRKRKLSYKQKKIKLKINYIFKKFSNL